MRKILAVAMASMLAVGFAGAVGGAEPQLEEGEVAWLRNGCATLLEEGVLPAADREGIDYWGPVCHGYAIAARDYIQFLTGSIQLQGDLPVTGCYPEGESITGREVARVFVDFVERHPESTNQPAVSVMFDAVTQHWCPQLLAQLPGSLP